MKRHTETRHFIMRSEKEVMKMKPDKLVDAEKIVFK